MTSVHFTTSTGIPSNPPPNVDVTVTDVSKVRALFEATITLPAQPQGTFNCPADFAVGYQLSFTSGATTTQFALDASGCEGLTGPDGFSAWALANDGYWSLLAETLGVQNTTIHPYAPPGG